MTTPTQDEDELNKIIKSALHQIRTRSLRDAPVNLGHVSMAELELFEKLKLREQSIKEQAEREAYRKGYQAGWETGRNGRLGPSRDEIKSKQEAWLAKQMKGKTSEKA